MCLTRLLNDWSAALLGALPELGVESASIVSDVEAGRER
jgi:hypothetical protein